jgi:hypothetical protein
MEYSKRQWNESRMEARKQRRLNNYIKWIRRSIKVDRNGKSPGEDNINWELCKYEPKEFKQRLLKFLNKITTPNEWRNAVVIPIFKKATNEIPKTIEQLAY